MNASLLRRRAGAALILVLLAAAVPAQAQIVYRGFDRVDQSDATFVSITSADMLGLEAVPVRSYSWCVAWGVRASAHLTGSALSARTLTGVGAGAGPIRAGVQQDLHALLYGRGRGMRIAAGLAPAGSSRAADDAAATLVGRLSGLLAASERLNPGRPGVAVPTRVAAALAAFDDYLDVSSAAFLAAPTDELLGVHAVLTELVAAAALNRDRQATRAPGRGLVCAGFPPPPPPPIPPPPPPPRLRFMVCTVTQSGPVDVSGRIDAAGDSVVILDRREVPLRLAFPALRDASEAAWYHDDGLNLVFGGWEYGKSDRFLHEMTPGSLVPFSTHAGVTVYREPGRERPRVVYVPVGGCWFHPYRFHEAWG